MGQGSIDKRIVEIAERVALENGLEMVHTEVGGPDGKPLIRIYIDKPEGVTHGDCEYITQHVGTILDVEDLIPGGRYTMEVSSPGVERKLSRPIFVIRPIR